MTPAEFAAWYAALGFAVLLVFLWDRRERGNPLGYAVLVIVAALTATYGMRGLEESAVYVVDPDVYGYTRFAAGTGAFLGVAATLVEQVKARGKPTLLSETGGIRAATERRAVAAEVANARNARMDAEGGEVTLLTETSQLVEEAREGNAIARQHLPKEGT